MDEQLKEQALSAITKAQSIKIVAFSKYGFDAVASALALSLSLQKLGKNAIIDAKQPTVNDALRLYGVDKIGKDTKKNLEILIENAVDNVDKVTYALEGDKLKIVVHNLPESKGVSTDEVSIVKGNESPNMLILIGANDDELLSNKSIHEHINNSKTFIISLSKEILTNKIAQLNLSIEHAPTVSEVVTAFLRDMALPIDEDIAYNLYAGIATSSKMFSPSISRPSTFEAALWLIKYGAGKASFASQNDEDLIVNKPEVADVDINAADSDGYSSPGFEIKETPQEDIEREKQPKDSSWLKPPKIYHGSKSFDSES